MRIREGRTLVHIDEQVTTLVGGHGTAEVEALCHFATVSAENLQLGRCLDAYFTHSIDGRLYGGWFRIVSQYELEVLAVGILRTVRFGGFDSEQAARSVLEEFVRRRMRGGNPVPTLNDKITTSATQTTSSDPDRRPADPSREAQ